MTLGEVSRGMDRLTEQVGHLAEKVGALAVDDARMSEKITRLEKVVYGALGVAGAALITALIGAVITVGSTR